MTTFLVRLSKKPGALRLGNVPISLPRLGIQFYVHMEMEEDYSCFKRKMKHDSTETWSLR